MTNRRRRWLRRLAIGVSLAAFAAPAAAKPIPGPNSMEIVTIRPDDRSDRFTVAQQTQSASTPVRPDDRADRFAIVAAASATAASTAVRPDDRADRFAIPAGATATSASDASVSWDGAVTIGLGTLVLVLALGLGLGYVRRPKVARI